MIRHPDISAVLRRKMKMKMSGMAAGLVLLFFFKAPLQSKVGGHAELDLSKRGSKQKNSYK